MVSGKVETFCGMRAEQNKKNIWIIRFFIKLCFSQNCGKLNLRVFILSQKPEFIDIKHKKML